MAQSRSRWRQSLASPPSPVHFVAVLPLATNVHPHLSSTTLAHSEQRFVVSVQSVAVRSLQLCWCSLLSQRPFSQSNFPLGQSGTLIRKLQSPVPNCATGGWLISRGWLADSISSSVTGFFDA